MRDVLKTLQSELTAVEPDVRALLDNEIAAINAEARRLGVEYVIR